MQRSDSARLDSFLQSFGKDLGTTQLRIHDEDQRLRALDSIAFPKPDKAYQDILKLASAICGTPAALVTLVGKTQQFFKFAHGTSLSGSKREDSFCQYTLNMEPHEILVVEDALLDSRFVRSPLVQGDPFIRFYAGVPLATSEGYNVGALCVIDNTPKSLTKDQKEALHVLRDHLSTYMAPVTKRSLLQRWFPRLFSWKPLAVLMPYYLLSQRVKPC